MKRRLTLNEATVSDRDFGPISFEIEPGSLVLLCGRSGSGKSTLCELLCGRNAADSGDVLGQEDSRVGFVAHDFENQLLGTTVAEELTLGAVELPDASPSGAVLDQLKGSLEELEASDPQQLCAFDQQMLLIASYLASGVDTLILDESLSQLDAQQSQELLSLLKTLCESGLSVIVVSHQKRVLEHADRVLMLESGKLAFYGSPREFDEPTAQRAGFLEAAEVLVSRPNVSGEAALSFGGRAGEFVLNAGELVTLCGNSGCGKSTALNSYFNLVPTDDFPPPKHRLRTALLRQHVGASFWQSSVEKEMRTSAEASSLSEQAISRIWEGIPVAWHQKSPSQLSHGQLRFFACHCLLIQGPELLFLDLPFQGLDGPLRRSLSEQLAYYTEQGGRLLITSQDPELAAAIGGLLVQL